MRITSRMNEDALMRFKVMGSQMAQEELRTTRRRALADALIAPAAFIGTGVFGYMSLKMQATPSWDSDAFAAAAAGSVAAFSTVGAVKARLQAGAEARALKAVRRDESRQRAGDPYGVIEALDQVNRNPHWPELRE